MADHTSSKVIIGAEVNPNDILRSMNKSSALSKEVRRVINIANKRIFRVNQKKDVISPSVEALRKEGIEKFTLRGSTWEQQKETYFRALNFINEDTSTLGDARAFTNEFLERTGMVSKAQTPEQHAKYLKYARDIMERYGIHDRQALEWIDSELIGQYFYDMRVEKTQNAIETGTRRDIEKNDADLKQEADEIARELTEIGGGSFNGI